MLYNVYVTETGKDRPSAYEVEASDMSQVLFRLIGGRYRSGISEDDVERLVICPAAEGA